MVGRDDVVYLAGIAFGVVLLVISGYADRSPEIHNSYACPGWVAVALIPVIAFALVTGLVWPERRVRRGPVRSSARPTGSSP